MAAPCPPRPSPVEATHLLSVSVDWPGWDVPHTRFAPHVVPCVWPPSRSVTCSSSLHVAACTVSRLCVAARTASFLRGPALLLGAAAFCSHVRQSVTFGASALVVLNHAAVRVRVPVVAWTPLGFPWVRARAWTCRVLGGSVAALGGAA